MDRDLEIKQLVEALNIARDLLLEVAEIGFIEDIDEFNLAIEDLDVILDEYEPSDE